MYSAYKLNKQGDNIVAILIATKCYLIQDLTCISLIISDVDYLFMHLLALYNFFGEISVQVFAHFLFRLFDFFVVFDQFFSSVYSGSESLYQIDFQIFSPNLWGFTVLIVSFHVVFNFHEVCLFFFYILSLWCNV